MGKTLVTGAAGFIGSHVVRELLGKGREVRAMLMPGEDGQNLDGLDVERVEADVLDRDAVVRAMDGVDRVFHLAAIYAMWLKQRERMYRVNCEGSLNVLWAARKAEVERLVYTSSIAAVGVREDGAPADETTLFNQMGRANDYVYSKWLSEVEAMTFAREGLPLVVCNPAFPFGARDVAPTPTGRLLLDMINGKGRLYIDGGFNIVDVADVARGHVLAEEHGTVGERYLLTNYDLTWREFFEVVSRITGFTIKPIRVPPRPLEWLGDYLERRADRVTGTRPLITGSGVRYGSQRLRFDNSRAQRELGLKFTPPEHFILKAVRWFADNGYIENPKFLRAVRPRLEGFAAEQEREIAQAAAIQMN